MNRILLASVLLGSVAVAQTPIACYDYEAHTLESTQPAFASVSDLTISNSYVWGGSSGNRWLCLDTDWNDDGGTITFTVTPNAGEYIDYSNLLWSSDTSAAYLSDSVTSFELYANGQLVGTVDPIMHLTDHIIDLSGVPELQAMGGPVTFELVFTGNPTGESSHESDVMKLYGAPCELEIDRVTPDTLDVVSRQCFTLDGDCFSSVTEVTFGSLTLPVTNGADFGAGAYKIIDDETLEVCPPFCLPLGDYTITVERANGDSDTIDVTIEQPLGNKLACPEFFPAGETMCIGVSAGTSQPVGNFIFIILSGSNVPSIIPGWIEAGLGNMFSDYLCGPAYLAECVEECYDIPLAMAGTEFYFQAVVWNHTIPTSPVFPTTNLCATTFY